MKIRGRAWKYGDDINTDVIYPGKYTYTIKDTSEMAQHALEDLDPSFSKNVQKNDFVVGGSNFGCGSSREQAASCLKYAGVAAVIARSFARLFFRNAINHGLPVIQCPEAVDSIENMEPIELDFEKGLIICSKGTFRFPAMDREILEILEAGGLIPFTRKKLNISG